MFSSRAGHVIDSKPPTVPLSFTAMQQSLTSRNKIVAHESRVRPASTRKERPRNARVFPWGPLETENLIVVGDGCRTVKCGMYVNIAATLRNYGELSWLLLHQMLVEEEEYSKVGYRWSVLALILWSVRYPGYQFLAIKLFGLSIDALLLGSRSNDTGLETKDLFIA